MTKKKELCEYATIIQLIFHVQVRYIKGFFLKNKDIFIFWKEFHFQRFLNKTILQAYPYNKIN